jgi:cytochrome c oxidase subunit IV
MDEHIPVNAVIHHEQHGGGTKEIIRVTIILTVLTIIELALGFGMVGMEDGFLKHFIKGLIIILMLMKAFYIIAYFMHLKHELRSLILTLAVPLIILSWAIIAFLADGHSFNQLKNKYDPYYKEKSTQKAPAHEEPAHGNKEEPVPLH